MNRGMCQSDEWRLTLLPNALRLRLLPHAWDSLFFRVEKFGEARIFLEEGKVLVVARMVAIGAVEADGDFQVGHGGIGFTGEAI